MTMADDINMVEAAKFPDQALAEQEREAMAATSIPDAKQPPTKPPTNYNGHPTHSVKHHSGGRY